MSSRLTRTRLLALLSDLGACSDARRWANETKRKTPAQLWATCPRGDWLLWIARRVDAHDRWTAADLACRQFAPMALEAAAKRHPALVEWPARLLALAPVTDKATALVARDLCREAQRDAAAYAYAAAYAADAYAAAADAAAAYAAYADAYAAAAAYAADAYAAYAASSSSSSYQRALAKARKRTAAIVRERITWASVEAALLAKEVRHVA